MYRVVHGNPTQTNDVQEFLDLLNNPFSPARELFNSKNDLIVSRAPGRLDVMGGIADYSGSHVLEFPLAEATFAAVQLNAERMLNIVTMLDDETRYSSFTMSLSAFDGPVEYQEARDFFRRDDISGWAAYVAGIFLVLIRERNVSFESGANILISSRVPLGKGVSSSAALEVAVMQAITEAFDINIEGRDKALLCQKVENLVVGAPCGVMDQMTAVFGERDRLLFMLCQPAELRRMITLPPQLMLWGIDSGIVIRSAVEITARCALPRLRDCESFPS
jgi:galactokinase